MQQHNPVLLQEESSYYAFLMQQQIRIRGTQVWWTQDIVLIVAQAPGEHSDCTKQKEDTTSGSSVQPKLTDIAG